MKKHLSYLIFILQTFFTSTLCAQDALVEEDKKRYLEYIEPAEDSLHQAFELLQYIKRGVVKGHDSDSMQAVLSTLRQRVRQRQIEYINQNPGSYASLYYFNVNLVNSTGENVDSLAAMYARFSKDLQATTLGRSVDASIRKKKALAVNNQMPLFTFKTHKGQEIDLSSFRGQEYVLICFWDSWCLPCIRNIPLLTTLYKEYRNKGLEMISVSLDKNEQKWLASIKKYEMPWLQTIDLPSYISGNSLQSLYDIHYIPQYFLLDKDGRLIYHNLFHNDCDDYTILQKVLYSRIRF